MEKDSVIPRGKFQEYSRLHLKAPDFPLLLIDAILSFPSKKKNATNFFPKKEFSLEQIITPLITMI